LFEYPNEALCTFIYLPKETLRMQQKNRIPESVEQAASTNYLPSRRNFLTKLTGAAAFTAVAASCTKEANFGNNAALLGASTSRAGNAVSMGQGDIAVLNYAYLLEQLEASFYIMVTSNFFDNISEYNKARFMQIRDHEIAHREFFKNALGDQAIPEIEFDFSMVDFSSNNSVIGQAKAFEDTGVAAYNGAGKFLRSADFLLAAGKIVSVEARHAAFLRSLDEPTSFAGNDVVDMNGLDVAKSPLEVVKIVAPYIKTQMDFSKLPG
jgi:hypothetical protein